MVQLSRNITKNFMNDSIIIIPTYNEKENIEKIISAIFSLEKAFDILVIDDGSPDGTGAIVKNLIEKKHSGRLFIIERSERHISRDSNGLSKRDMSTSSKWMLTSLTTLTTFLASILHVTMRGMMLPSVLVMSLV